MEFVGGVEGLEELIAFFGGLGRVFDWVGVGGVEDGGGAGMRFKSAEG